MKRVLLIPVLASAGLAGCNQPRSISEAPGSHGRYASAGTYSAGRMWSQIAGAQAPKDAATAKLSDDEQIIVVLDSQTGELRQCGNISGFCVDMNPWAKPAGASAPLAVAKHEDQLQAEAEAKLAAQSKPR